MLIASSPHGIISMTGMEFKIIIGLNGYLSIRRNVLHRKVFNAEVKQAKYIGRKLAKCSKL